MWTESGGLGAKLVNLAYLMDLMAASKSATWRASEESWPDLTAPDRADALTTRSPSFTNGRKSKDEPQRAQLSFSVPRPARGCAETVAGNAQSKDSPHGESGPSETPRLYAIRKINQIREFVKQKVRN